MGEQLLAILAGAGISIAAAWLVGNALAARLDREKKFTERDVEALTTFDGVYGEFFAAWKEWGNSPKDEATVLRILPMACQVEGRYEALLIMLCSDRVLSQDELSAMGALRQGLQQLREAIKERRNVDWWDPSDRHYEALKFLAAYVAVTLRPRTMGWAGRTPTRPGPAKAANALLTVTSFQAEDAWVDTAERLGLRCGLIRS